MTFKHTKRNGFLFVILSIITIGIFDLIVLSHVGKEVDEMYPEGKKSAPFWVMWLLSFITLGIVALIWFARVADKLNKVAAREGTPCKITYEKMIGWNLFGIFIIIGPFIAWGKFFRALNAVETKYNEDAILNAPFTPVQEEEAPQVVEEEEPVANETVVEEIKEEEPKETIPENQVLPEEKSEEIVAIEAPKEEVAPEEAPKEAVKPAPYRYVTEEAAEEKPIEEKIMPVPAVNSSRTYHVTRRKEVKKWAVRYANGAKAVKLFDTQAEAVAYAKMLATKKGVSIRVHGKNGKMRRF